jgi:hypothetical protein
VNLHVWSKKEIENYLLQPRAIRRVLASRVKDREMPSEWELHTKVLEICERERRSVEDGIASAIVQPDRKLDVGTANERARERVERAWGVEANRMSLVSGKDLLARLSEWTQKRVWGRIWAPAVARHMTAADISSEMAEVISAIEGAFNFPSYEDRHTSLPSQ